MIPSHRAAHRLLPGRLVAIESQRAVESGEQRGRVLLVEAEAPAIRAFLDRVVEPAHRVHQRQRAVAQRIELVQPAGLEARGHQEHVGARLDAVGELVVEPQLRRDAARVFLGQRGKLLFQRAVAGAEQGELHLALHHAGERLGEHVVAFLVREPADGGGQQRLRLLIEA